MKFALIFLIAFTYIHVISSQKSSIRICSFNVQIFGSKKAKNTQVMKILGDIFKQYDLCLIQEIRDTKDDSIRQLQAAINQASGGENYDLVVSTRLGRTNSKEQYGYFYRKDKLKVLDTFQFDEGNKLDLFQRPPFVARFQAKSAPVKDFFVAGIHTEPASAGEEIGHLVKVYDAAQKKWGIKDAVIMGDYNAGCSYMPKKAWPTNPLRKDPRFLWLIGDDANTTVGKSDCPYDRFVIAGDNFQKHAKYAKTHYYDREMSLSADQARVVSDHYPITFTME